MTSSQYMAASRAAVFEELVKIGEAASSSEKAKSKSRWGRDVALGILGAAGGAGLGHAAGMLLTNKIAPGFFRAGNPSQKYINAAKITLPVLGGLGFILADRYRQKLDEKYRGRPVKKKPNEQ